MNTLKRKTAGKLSALVAQLYPGAALSPDDLAGMLEFPPDPAMGDLALPCFKLSRSLHASPVAIADALARVDASRAEAYKANAETYRGKLAAVDKEYEAAVAASPKKTLLFGDRFPFLYLCKDYGINYYAAFKGCSAATEVSPATFLFLKNKIEELDIKVILVLESSDQKIAKSIRQETTTKDQTILVIDSLQSATKKEYESGRNYLNIMTSNLGILQQALA